MKICAIICEYNPFHNGHLYQLRTAQKRSGADAVVCVMSGNFVQRGEASILHKYLRARHAVLAGADAVVELPTVFATSNAELFAKGAVKLLASIPAVRTLCFGAENADKTAFTQTATMLTHEPKTVSEKIKNAVSQGVSYAKARATAWEEYIPQELLQSPNNILGLEYVKALQAFGADIEILPVKRKGGEYSDTRLRKNYSSASAIRQAISQRREVAENLPDFVARDLSVSPQIANEESLKSLEKYAVLSHTKEQIAQVCDCTEGLENAFKKVATENEDFVQTLTSARYTSSRIRRIALQNLLKIDEKLVRDSLASPLYLRVLAVNKRREDVLSALSESPYPLLIRAHDENLLDERAKRCFETDVFADDVYRLLNPSITEKNIFI